MRALGLKTQALTLFATYVPPRISDLSTPLICIKHKFQAKHILTLMRFKWLKNLVYFFFFLSNFWRKKRIWHSLFKKAYRIWVTVEVCFLWDKWIITSLQRRRIVQKSGGGAVVIWRAKPGPPDPNRVNWFAKNWGWGAIVPLTPASLHHYELMHTIQLYITAISSDEFNWKYYFRAKTELTNNYLHIQSNLALKNG